MRRGVYIAAAAALFAACALNFAACGGSGGSNGGDADYDDAIDKDKTDADETVGEREENPDAPLNPYGDLAGVYLDPISLLGWDAAKFDALFAALKNNGYKAVVVPFTAQLEWTLYPTQSVKLKAYKQGSGDWLEALYGCADGAGITVYTGLWRERMTARQWDADQTFEFDRAMALIEDLNARYAKYSSFGGLYFHYETPYYLEDKKRTATKILYEKLVPAIHDKYPKLGVNIRIRYPGRPIKNWLSVEIDKWLKPADIDDYADVDEWAAQWMALANKVYVDAFFVEAQNGAGRFELSKTGALLAALAGNRGSSSAKFHAVADLFSSKPGADEKNLTVRKTPAKFAPKWDEVGAVKSAMPLNSELFGFDARSLFSEMTQDDSLGLPAAFWEKTRKSALWVERRMNSCCVRDGMINTVAFNQHDFDRGENVWQEDACWLTGLYLSALTYKAAAAGDERAKKQAAYTYKVLLKMAETTPLKGEVVRDFVSYLFDQTNPVSPGSTTIKRWHKSPTGQIFWVGDISVDQLSGYFHGIANYYDLLADADEKAKGKEIFAAVADAVISNDMRAKEFNGLSTTYGDFYKEPILAFDLLSIASHFTQNSKYKTKYVELLEKGYSTNFFNQMAILFMAPGQANFQHFTDSAFYHTFMYNLVPDVYGELALAAQYVYQRSFDYGIAWGALNYAALDPKAEGLTRALYEMYQFVPQFLDNGRWYAAINERFDSGYVQFDRRPAREFDWSTSMDEDGGAGPRNGPSGKFSGVGFLMTYWLAVYHGLAK